MPRLVSVTRTPDANKQFVAKFVQDNGRSKTVRFGTKSNYVENPKKTKEDRTNYIARHSVNEDFSAPMTPGALSRHLLWGQSRSLGPNVAAFRRKFKV